MSVSNYFGKLLFSLHWDCTDVCVCTRHRKPRLLDNNYLGRSSRNVFKHVFKRDIVFKPMLEVEMYIT